MSKVKQPSLWTKSFTVLCLANFLMSTAFYFLLPTLPVYFVNVMGAGGVQTGYLLAAYTLSALLVRPFAGFSVDFFGRKSLFLGSFALFAFFFGFYSFAAGISLMLLLRFLHGIAWAGVTTAGSTLVVDLVPAERRGEGLGVFGMAMTTAMAIGPALGLLILQLYDFKTMFISASLLCFAGLFAALTVRYPVFERSVENGKFRFSSLFEVSSIPASLGMLIIMIPFGGIISYIALYSNEHSLGNSGMFFLIFALGVGLARVVAGRIFDRSGPDKLIYAACVMYVAGFLTLAYYKTTPGFYFSGLLLGISNGIVFPVFQAMVNNLVPPYRRGAANSTLFTAIDLGIGMGMMLMGFIYDVFSLTSVYSLSAVIILVALPIYYFFVRCPYRRNMAKIALQKGESENYQGTCPKLW